jgi:internalin A
MQKNTSRFHLKLCEQGLSKIAKLVPPDIVKFIKIDLDLSGNCLDEEQEDLLHLKSIKTLNLSLNHILNIYPLPLSLEFLNLSCNHIQDLKPLSILNRLKRLDLSCNLISNIEPLQYLKSLKTLLLGYNLLQDLQVLQTFHQLVEIDLEHNKLTSLSSVLPLIPSAVLVFILKNNPVLM